MIESNVMDTLRDEVKSELINQAGRYNPNNRDVNVRIVEDIRVAIDESRSDRKWNCRHFQDC